MIHSVESRRRIIGRVSTGAALVAALAATVPPCWAQSQLASVEGSFTARDGRTTGVVVYLTPIDAVNAARAPTAPVTASIDQRGLQFLPRTVAVSPGSVVSFPNSDPVLHNIFLVDQQRARVDLGTYPGGEFRSITLASSGVYLVLCHLHPEMVASVVVVDAPYRTVADSAGHFRIDGVAPGAYRLRTWHRRLLPHEQTITVAPGDTVRVRAFLESGASRPRRRPPHGRSR